MATRQKGQDPCLQPGEKCRQVLPLGVVESEIQRGEGRVEVGRRARADDDGGDKGVAEDPRERQRRHVHAARRRTRIEGVQPGEDPDVGTGNAQRIRIRLEETAKRSGKTTSSPSNTRIRRIAGNRRVVFVVDTGAITDRSITIRDQFHSPARVVPSRESWTGP